ncbi:MAG: alpha/beta hydrolase, partial [Pseudomonadota bacterium]
MITFDIPRKTAEAILSDDTSLRLDMPQGRIHYRSIGQGPAVILVHNSGMWGGVWDAWIGILSREYRVVVPDLPGFGLTGPTASADYSYRTLSQFLADFIELTCDGQPSHVVGLSLGGQLALRCALSRGDLIKSLVLINPTGYPEKTVPNVFKFARGPLGWLLPYLGSKALLEKNLRQLWGNESGTGDGAEDGAGNFVSDVFLQRLLVSQRCKGNRRAFLKFLRTDNESVHEAFPLVTAPVQV